MANRSTFLMSLPPDHLEAFRKAAKRARMPLSAWIRMCCIKELPSEVEFSLSDSPPAHRPRESVTDK